MATAKKAIKTGVSEDGKTAPEKRTHRAKQAYIVDKNNFCLFFGIDGNTFDRYVSRGMPVEQKSIKRGMRWKVNAPDAVAWIRSDDKGNVTPMHLESLGVTQARRIKLEIENQLKGGETLLKTSVSEAFQEYVGMYKSRLRGQCSLLAKGDTTQRQALLEFAIKSCDDIHRFVTDRLYNQQQDIQSLPDTD